MVSGLHASQQRPTRPYRTHVTLVDPDRALLDAGPVPYARCELALATARLDATCDVVVCDPDRPELDAMLEELLTTDVRRIGVHGGTGRVTAPVDLTRVRLDVGLTLGARSPAEAAVSIIGELIADRNGA